MSFLLNVRKKALAARLLGCFNYATRTPSTSTLIRRQDGLTPRAFPTLFSLFIRGARPFRFCGKCHLFTTSNSSVRVPGGPTRSASRCSNIGNDTPCGVLRLSTVCSLLRYACRSTSLVNSERTGRNVTLYHVISHSSIRGTVVVTSEKCRNCGLVTRVRRGN